MTIVHHASKGGVRPRMLAQDVCARKLYARKHFGPVQRRLYLAALASRHLIRLLGAPAGGVDGAVRREGALRSLNTLVGRVEPPFGAPPPTALEPHATRVAHGAASRLSSQ